MGCMTMAVEREGDNWGTMCGNTGDLSGSESDKVGNSKNLEDASSAIARTMKCYEGSHWEDDSGQPIQSCWDIAYCLFGRAQ